MPVRLTPTVEWIAHCFEHGDTHEHVSVYLLREGDDVILVDSGSVYHREEILTAVTDATDGSGPDALILSHSDYPHAGNIRQLGAGAGDVELVASSGSPSQQGLPQARRCTIGGQLTVKGRTFSFIDPPLADRSHTTWIFDHRDGVLFTADGFGNYHTPGACSNLSGDFPDGTPLEHIVAYHRDNLVWLRYVDPSKVELALEDIFDRFEIRAIAPIHGNPIEGKDIPLYRERLSESIQQIATAYEVPEVE